MREGEREGEREGGGRWKEGGRREGGKGRWKEGGREEGVEGGRERGKGGGRRQLEKNAFVRYKRWIFSVPLTMSKILCILHEIYFVWLSKS